MKTKECEGKSYPAIRECWCSESVNKNADDAFTGPIIWQHGELEGAGNSIESCANEYGGGTNADTFAFLTCFESSEHGGRPSALAPCAEANGLNATNIQSCYDDDEKRQAVVRDSAHKTCALNPQHQYTPWVVLQGEHIETPRSSAALTKTICEAAHSAGITPLPTACSEAWFNVSSV